MNVIMPQLGETVLEGMVANWYKKVGDKVEADESLFDVETDKVTSEIPTPVAGVLTEILVAAGTTVKVGTVLAIIREEGSTSEVTAAPASENVVAAVARPAIAGNSAQIQSRMPERSNDAQVRLSPVVRRLLGENGLSPEQVTGTGNNGRITREDVLAYLASKPSRLDKTAAPLSRHTAATTQPVLSAPQPVAVSVGKDDLVLPLNKIRRATASHMVRSKTTTPHAVQAVEVDFQAVDKARQAVGKEWKEREGYSLTYMPFIVRAVCDAIGKYPYINSSFGNDELIVHKRVHLGIAVDVNFEGLLATVVRDADHRNLRGLAAEINRLASAARRNQLKPDELAGGTYTISNSGTFGTLFSTSIINQPQAAILSADGVRKKPVVIEGPDGDVIAIRPIGILAQSFDHRAFDGAYSASFLRYLKEIIENRDWLNEI
ncbi:Dihydrolipoamide acetyltransferase component of pyruvate dehydrogenase complex [Georgfuchsia toluolica]|uniref:Dihydrolipoamide acetyltransferase component of pyruvate dehydrogenase complex n=1 Tax=Georgfuchsia toluolica TaxID=424218 RepID=A0A916J2H7_9PROT|nr:dihydrolipoamide acetyltransferase family protein [Georgfuchsia toluolica]CAG4882765.1 Dihydrolipoamide acetyltransferase component of pyruvate dehydrogenase complex [Georgfuchsia toluolica]